MFSVKRISRFFDPRIEKRTLVTVLFHVCLLIEMQIDSDVNKAMDEAETDTLPRGATSISSERADGESVDVSMRDQKHIYILTLQLYVKLFETKIKEFSNHNELIESSWWKWNSGIMIEIARMVLTTPFH